MTNLFGRTKFYSFLLAAALLLAAGPAFAEKRVALVIGNAAYQNAPRLPNPVNDGKFRSLEVKSKDGYKIQARKGYYPPNDIGAGK